MKVMLIPDELADDGEIGHSIAQLLKNSFRGIVTMDIDVEAPLITDAKGAISASDLQEIGLAFLTLANQSLIRDRGIDISDLGIPDLTGADPFRPFTGIGNMVSFNTLHTRGIDAAGITKEVKDKGIQHIAFGQPPFKTADQGIDIPDDHVRSVDARVPFTGQSAGVLTGFTPDTSLRDRKAEEEQGHGLPLIRPFAPLEDTGIDLTKFEIPEGRRGLDAKFAGKTISPEMIRGLYPPIGRDSVNLPRAVVTQPDDPTAPIKESELTWSFEKEKESES